MNRCAYCGNKCYGTTCRNCMALKRNDPTPPRPKRDRSTALRFRATCPRCGDVASPRAFTCASCGTPLYLPKSDPMYAAPGTSREAVPSARERGA